MKASAFEESTDFLASFDEDFFSEYNAQLADVDLEAQAQEALAGILTVQSEGERARTYQEIKAEAEIFFANPWVNESLVLMDTLAQQYAQFCNHNHEAADVLNAGMLESVYSQGNNLITNTVADTQKEESVKKNFFSLLKDKTKNKEKKKATKVKSFFSRFFANNVKLFGSK